MSVRKSLVVTAVTVAITAVLPVISNLPAQAAGTGTGVGYTLEGCRASANAYVTNYVCAPSAYTTGNLGGGWNELDYVPGRVVVHAGNSAPAAGQDVSFDVAVDNCSDGTGATGCTTGTPGYDQLSEVTINSVLSTAGGCSLTADATTGYSGVQLYRQVDLHFNTNNADCVLDYYARLAIGAHAFSGSSLHYNLTNTSHNSSGIGNKDVSIPVKPILQLGFSKIETASQGSDVTWSIGKSLGTDEGGVNFPNTCDANASTSQVRHITVTWTKNATDRAITVDGAISITNTAHRPLTFNVSDQLYDGVAGTTADSDPKGHTQTLAAGASDTYHDTWTPNVATTGYNDIASAYVTDPTDATLHVNLPNATASASVVHLDPGSGGTAVVSDIEALTDGANPASNYTFSVAAPASGTIYTTYDPAHPANNHYVAGTATTGPLTWVSPPVSDSGSITFTKTINVVGHTAESATLHDVATVTGDQQDAVSSDPLNIGITASAKVSIAISKTITAAINSDRTFTFNAYEPGHSPTDQPPGDGSTSGSTTVTVLAGHTTPTTTPDPIGNLDPGVIYTVDEPALAPFPETTHTASATLPDCSVTLPVVNTAAPAKARVQKITQPALPLTTWAFSLSGMKSGVAVSDLSGGTSEALSSVTAGAGYSGFSSNLDVDGATYTITETTTVAHWDVSSITGDIASVTNGRVTWDTTAKTCSFVLDLAGDSGHIFSCTFTNTQEADVTVVKTQSGQPPSQPFSFTLCPGSPSGTTCATAPPGGSSTLTTNSNEVPLGTLDFGYQVPGAYTICEDSVPAGMHSSLQDFSGAQADGLGNVCLAFTLSPGTNKTFNINNRAPGGNPLTIGYWKHWNSVNVGNSAASNKLMDTYLVAPYPPLYLGNFLVDTATTGVSVLSHPSMQYAENGLAAQLLASKLNLRAGAVDCATIDNAITTADGLLAGLAAPGYSPGSMFVGNKYPNRKLWVSTQSTLDQYNNNKVC